MQYNRLVGATPFALFAATSFSPAAHAQTEERDMKPSWTNDIVVAGQREGYAVPNSSAARRTNTSLIDVPQSVQVINRTLIEEQDCRT